MSCEQFKRGDWVIIDDWLVGEISNLYLTDVADIIVHHGVGQDYSFETIRIKQHQITPIPKEVADIIRGV